MVRQATLMNEPYRWVHQRQRYQEIVRRLLRATSKAVDGTRLAEAEPAAESSR
jgi:hypothetical protein